MPYDTFTQCDHPDYEGLIEFYTAMNGPNWADNTGWTEDNLASACNPCSWSNIGCENNRVTSLTLEDTLVRGTLVDIQLDSLKILILANARIQEGIPNFSGLESIEYIHLASCGIQGNIPNFSHLNNLRTLDLSGNNLSGSIPNFDNLKELTALVLRDNLLSGPIPDFNNLPQLKSLLLGNNEFTGEIPEFSNLRELEYFEAPHNNFNSKLPDFKLPKLKKLHIPSANLMGSIPEFSSLFSLERLNLNHNNLVGPLPRFTNSAKLEWVYLNDCQIDGLLPDYAEQLPVLVSMNLQNNNLEGCYPPSICDRKIIVSGNPKLPWNGFYNIHCNPIDEFSESPIGAPCGGLENFNAGTIQNDCSCLAEPCTSDHPDFETLMTLYDATNGTEWIKNTGWEAAKRGWACDPCKVIDNLGGWSGITCNENGRVIGIDFDGNDDGIIGVDIGGNNMSGQLTPLNLPYLEYLILTGNDLSGPIPNFDNLVYLESIGLSFNQLSGSIPDFEKNVWLTDFRGSYNQLSGQLPDLSQHQFLTAFTASNNLLSGCFPQGTCDLNLFSMANNSAMPWEGVHTKYCQGVSEMGAPCQTESGLEGTIDINCVCQSSTSSYNVHDAIITLYPNPTADQISILSKEEWTTYQIFDSKGRLVASGHIASQWLDTSQLAAGLHWLKLKNNKGESTTKRFIKL